MNVYEFAIKMEQDGEKYYRSLNSHIDHRGLSSLLNALADDEVKHAQVLQAMASGSNGKQMPESSVLSTAKNVFQEIIDSDNIPDADSDIISLLEKALELERQSEQFYLEKEREITELDDRQIFQSIAAEEKKHYCLIEELIAFHQQPRSYLESGEFGKLDQL
jgi:rubrerythrin